MNVRDFGHEDWLLRGVGGDQLLGEQRGVEYQKNEYRNCCQHQWTATDEWFLDAGITSGHRLDGAN